LRPWYERGVVVVVPVIKASSSFSHVTEFMVSGSDRD
jgi:hypothetical protein